MKKLLLGAAAVSLMAGSAYAVEADNETPGATGVADVVPLAAEALGVSGDIIVELTPTGAQFPTGNVLINVTVNGALFDGALAGTEVTGIGACTPTSVISSGGADATNQVTFLVSGLDTCLGAGTEAVVTLPVDVTNGSDVSTSIFLTTDAGAPVDGTSSGSPVVTGIVDRVDAFGVTFVPDTVCSEAAIGVGTPFVAFNAVTPCDGDIGDIDIDITTGAVVDLLGTAVATTDLTGVGVTVTGSTAAYGAPGSIDVAEGGGGDAATVVTTASGFTFAAGAPAAFDVADIVANDISVGFTPDGVTPIESSNYLVAVSLTLGGNLAGSDSASGALQSVTREGTTIIFPWTQVGTTSAASGVASVYRIGNLSEGATGAVFVEVDNWTNSSFMAPAGPVQIAASIAANGELVVNGATILGALGDYGRGDLIFTVEENPDNITGRLLQVLNGNLTPIAGGNVTQDQN